MAEAPRQMSARQIAEHAERVEDGRARSLMASLYLNLADSLRATGDAPALTGKLIDTIHHVDVNNEGPYHSASFDRIAGR